MGPIGCPDTLARNYHYSLRNNREERSSHLLRGGNLKSRICRLCLYVCMLNVILCIPVLSVPYLYITLPTPTFALSSLPFDFLSNTAQVHIFISQSQQFEVSSASNQTSGEGISI
jgi:hypothetical protein